ncbi:DegV family protein [Geosporobacter ferrireducens]|uniref:Fatty acid-binding protein DegV n=1 Tax=Geosporobacter ferrireducens TaxID=1424294 RepID=A0A1D8GER4_9FIRM|nr:DegV family protein [Geosporobacter ferrireducens]AOT69378.1 fatty acid-binding protein DegV [Geosporobacter ferrireducens]MTI57069.1 DegV family protein [Geosporobacter ferrireducens]
MNNVKLFTDSTCDLSTEMLTENDISVIPLYITFNELSYKDSIDMNTAELYSKVDALGILPKTAAPTPSDFLNAFKPFVDAGKDIVYIGLSSQLSSTVQNALLAAREFPKGKVNVIDSLNLSTGVGILVMKAVDFKREGLSAKEITERISEIVPKGRTFFTIDTYEYLYKGGRCSAMQGLVGSMLQIKPITKLVDGNIVLYDKQRGRKKVLASLLQEINKDLERIDPSRVFIVNSFAKEDAIYLEQELKNKLNLGNVVITDAGCVISSHCGKKALGISYITK